MSIHSYSLPPVPRPRASTTLGVAWAASARRGELLRNSRKPQVLSSAPVAQLTRARAPDFWSVRAVERRFDLRTAQVAPAPPPPAPPPSDPIEARYRTLCAVARAEGFSVDHCKGADCWTDDDAILCTCRCPARTDWLR